MWKWKRFRLRLTSEETGRSHFEEIYLAEEVNDALLSYETLQRLGHEHHKTFTRPHLGLKKKPQSQENIRTFFSQCEDTTTFDIDDMEYSCNCPRTNMTIMLFGSSSTIFTTWRVPHSFFLRQLPPPTKNNLFVHF